MKNRKNTKQPVSLNAYCMQYVQRFNAKQLANSWKRKAAYAAATTVATAGFMLSSIDTTQAQITCTPQFNVVPVVSFTQNPNGLTDIGSYSNPDFVDFDGDGDFDLLVGEKSGKRIVYIRNIGTNAAPNWAAPVFNPNGINIVSGAINDYVSPEFVDIDGDGDLDLFVGMEGVGILYFQNNAGVYAAEQLNPFGLTSAGIDDITPDFADLDGDGDLDLLIGSGGGTTAGSGNGSAFYYENTGTSTAPAFAAPVANPFGLTDVGSWTHPEMVDLDNDGDLDIMFCEFGQTYNYFENIGTATAPNFALVRENPFSLIPTANTHAATFADINNDGDLDMISGAGNGNFYYYENTGSDTQPVFGSLPFGITTPNDGYSAPAFADIDGDGDLDLFVGVAGGKGESEIFYSENVGTTTAPNYSEYELLITFTNGSEANPTLADIDGDGDYDMLVGASDGNYYYYKNNGTTSVPDFVASPEVNPFGLVDTGSFSAPQFVDFDRDGDIDLFSGGGGLAGIMYMKNVGTATAPQYAPFVRNPFGITDANRSFLKIGTADVDGDDDIDLIVGRPGEVVFYGNVGTVANPAFAAPIINPYGILDPNSWYNPELVDVDNDGAYEAFVGEESGQIRVYENSKALPQVIISEGTSVVGCGDVTLTALPTNYLITNIASVNWYDAETNEVVGSNYTFVAEVANLSSSSYYARVTSVDGCGGRSATTTVTCSTPLPEIAISLAATAGYNTANLTWTVEGTRPVREYEVYGDPGGFGSYFLFGYSRTTSYEAVGLINGQPITFRVRPIYMDGAYGLYSNTVTVKPSIVLGEEDNEKAGFAFFPNPNNGEFNLRLQDGSNSATVSVTSLSGQRVYTTTLNATQTSINLGKIASGMYIVRVETSQGIYQQKVSVVR
jgi:hypothetical protein